MISLLYFMAFRLKSYTMITVHFNYAKRRLDSLKLLTDARTGGRKHVKRANETDSAWWENFVSETVIEEDWR